MIGFRRIDDFGQLAMPAEHRVWRQYLLELNPTDVSLIFSFEHFDLM